MKQKLLLLCFSLLMSTSLMAQITAGQVDDFEDGTVQDWVIAINGASAPNDPTNVTTGGPDGLNDNFLNYVTTGAPGGAGSRTLIINQSSDWMGNYTAQSILSIKLDVRAEASSLNVRVAFDGGGGTMCTTNAVVVAAGTGWTTVVIPISSSDFTLVDAGSDIAATLLNVTQMRILSSPTPAWRGEVFSGTPTTMDVDNIEASTTLSTNDEVFTNDFSIYPNPSSSKLKIALPTTLNNAKVEVHDILGKRIYSQNMNTVNKSIDVSQWNSGVYLVKVSSDTSSQTKRFIKQ